MISGSNLAHHLLLYGLQTENGFPIFPKVEKKIKIIFNENYVKIIYGHFKVLLEYSFVYILFLAAFTQ